MIRWVSISKLGGRYPVLDHLFFDMIASLEQAVLSHISYADIEWDDTGTPISSHFCDPYYSRTDGQAETRHVFLSGNGLPERWHGKAKFTIAELGFGTGLNFLETAAQWQRQSNTCKLNYVAFEKFPMPVADLIRALAPWHGLSKQIAELTGFWPPQPGWSTHIFNNVTLELAIGDANDTLETWYDAADAWYLDGFSPEKNPDLWGEDLMKTVAKHTRPDGTFATFTAAGWVRRNLQAAGFQVQKMPGFGRKRECLHGHLLAQHSTM